MTGCDNSQFSVGPLSYSCCSQANKCDHGEVDCEIDQHCLDGLFHGFVKYILKAHSCTNYLYALIVCFHMHVRSTVTECDQSQFSSGYEEDCCNQANPCDYGEGDCDKDEDCFDGLSCDDSWNNCETGHGFVLPPEATGKGHWDCCEAGTVMISAVVLHCSQDSRIR